MKNERQVYTDTIYGYTAEARSATAAWMLIRNRCHQLGIEVPTIDKIKLKQKSK